jgi:hypothetical protein
MKTIIQVKEASFREAGEHTDKALSIIKECEELIDGDSMMIPTNTRFDLDTPEIGVLNYYLQNLRSNGIVSVQIILE